MLINVFGLWLMAANISFLNSTTHKDACVINFLGQDTYATMQKRTCKEIAAEINKQLKESK